MLSEQILFLCRVNRVNFPHFKILAPLSRHFPLLRSDFPFKLRVIIITIVVFCFVLWFLTFNNRPFPSCCEPHYESEARCKTFHTKISFVCK